MSKYNGEYRSDYAALLMGEFFRNSLRYFKGDTINVDGAICVGGDPFIWEGQEYTKPGDYFMTIKSRIYDCDSVHNILHLHLQYPINMSVNYSPQAICARKGSIDVPFSVYSGDATSYDFIFSDDALRQGFTNRYDVPIPKGESKVTVNLDNYAIEDTYSATIVFHNLNCDSASYPIDFVISYDAEKFINQRWNDFLSVSKTAYDKYGGFTGYQWYKDNVPLPGQTGSQLYLPEEGLDSKSGYSVEMTRLSDGARVRTCPYYPVSQPKTVTLSVFPTVVTASNRMPLRISISESAEAQLYHQSGTQVAKWQIEEGDNSYMMPSVPGLYLLRILTASGEQLTRKIIVE